MLKRIVVGVIVSGMLAATVLPAAAKATPAQKCAAAKQKAAGKDASGELACYSKAVGKAITVDPICLGKSTGKFTAAFTKAGTACVGDATALQSTVDGCIDQVLGVVTGTGKCQAAKIKAAGGKAAAKLNCTAKAAGSGKPLDPACIGKAETKFAAAVTKADAKGVCPGTASAIETVVDNSCFNGAASQLPPVAPGCGNGIIEAGETCDDGPNNGIPPDACPAGCVVDGCTAVNGSSATFTIGFAGSTNVGGLDVFVDYPEGKVSIPGSGNDPNVVASITNLPGGAIAVSNDVDWGLIQSVAAFSAIPVGPLFTIHFQTCQGAAAAVPGDFTCTVRDASDPIGNDLTGVTCSVSAP